jgi:hypothetical protein
MYRCLEESAAKLFRVEVEAAGFFETSVLIYPTTLSHFAKSGFILCEEASAYYLHACVPLGEIEECDTTVNCPVVAVTAVAKS